MKGDDKKVLFTAAALVFFTYAPTSILAITNAKSSDTKLLNAKQKEKDLPGKGHKNKEISKNEEEQISTAGQDKLAQLAKAFQEKPDDNKYGALWENFVAFIQLQKSKHKDPSHLIKDWKDLSAAGLKVIDPMGAENAVHIYAFNQMAQNTSAFVPQTKYALIQWNEQAINPVSAIAEHKLSKRERTRKSTLVTVMKSQLINVPSSVDLKEANLVPQISTVKIWSKTSAKTSVKASAKALLKNHKTNKSNSLSNHYLAILGVDQQSGHAWVSAMKQTCAGWSLYPNLFADIPSFLLETSSTKIRFSGNNLIISMGGASGYELVMPFTENHFAFSTKEAQDSAEAVARQFLLAVQYKKVDLAKVWLLDPKLVSIPAYIGLFNRPNDSPPLKIVNMPSPICGGSRFRLFTGNKDDLIIDVAKIKNQWLIKGLFIAPGNPSTDLGVKNTANSLN